MQQTESKTQAGTDPVVMWLTKNGHPVTRETYLQVAYPEIVNWKQQLEGELESMLPEEIQV